MQASCGGRHWARRRRSRSSSPRETCSVHRTRSRTGTRGSWRTERTTSIRRCRSWSSGPEPSRDTANSPRVKSTRGSSGWSETSPSAEQPMRSAMYGTASDTTRIERHLQLGVHRPQRGDLLGLLTDQREQLIARHRLRPANSTITLRPRRCVGDQHATINKTAPTPRITRRGRHPFQSPRRPEQLADPPVLIPPLVVDEHVEQTGLLQSLGRRLNDIPRQRRLPHQTERRHIRRRPRPLRRAQPEPGSTAECRVLIVSRQGKCPLTWDDGSC